MSGGLFFTRNKYLPNHTFFMNIFPPLILNSRIAYRDSSDIIPNLGAQTVSLKLHFVMKIPDLDDEQQVLRIQRRLFLLSSYVVIQYDFE